MYISVGKIAQAVERSIPRVRQVAQVLGIEPRRNALGYREFDQQQTRRIKEYFAEIDAKRRRP